MISKALLLCNNLLYTIGGENKNFLMISFAGWKGRACMSSKTEEIKQEKSTKDYGIHLYISQGKGLSVKHWQSNIEVCQIYAGEYQFVVGKQRFAAQPGDVIFIPDGELHQLGSTDKTAKIRIYTFNKKLLCNLLKELHCIKNHITLSQMQQLGVAEEIAAVIDEIYDEHQYQKPESKHMIQADFIRLCSLLLRHFKTEQPREKTDLGKLSLVQTACEYIAQNYRNDISLQDLAKATNYSCSYISSIFADVAGITFKEYLETYRINQVISCITETGCSYSSAAAKCGFNSIRTFNNAFKRVTGTTPSAFFNSAN